MCMGARIVVSIWSVQVNPSDSRTSQLTLSMSRRSSPQAKEAVKSYIFYGSHA